MKTLGAGNDLQSIKKEALTSASLGGYFKNDKRSRCLEGIVDQSNPLDLSGD
jgi:hypothetical protein